MGRALSSYASDPTDYDPDGLRKHVKPETAGQIEALVRRLETLDEWSAAAIEAALRETAEAAAVAAGKLIHPTRLALTGIIVGAPLFDVFELLGKDTSLRRLKRFTQRIRSTAGGPPPGSG
jgi:glutamyl/glutaminyl-tRNA synthetase